MKSLFTFIALMCLCAAYATAGPKEDFALFRNGEKQAWDSTGHEKSKGISMKISYPRTWKAMEGSRPNIVQKFASDAGRGVEMVMIITKALPREITLSEKQEFLSVDAAKDLISDGGRLVSHKKTKIDGEDCAMIEAEDVRERVGQKIASKTLTFIIPRKDVLLIIQCATGGDASPGFDAIRKHYDEVKPLFLLISSSCVLTDKWKTP